MTLRILSAKRQSRREHLRQERWRPGSSEVGKVLAAGFLIMKNGKGLEKTDPRKLHTPKRIQRECNEFRASGPISRILSSRPRVIATRELRSRAQTRRRSFLWAADHSAARCGLPEGFARTPWGPLASSGPSRPSPPIWPCTARGLPCRGHCCPRGRLLPYRFTLAKWRALKRSARGLASG